jgi:hypothetical protein
VPDPATGCLLPVVSQNASLQMKDNGGESSDSFVWKWITGDATTVGDFGTPTAADDYEFCVYDADPDLLMRARAPAAGTCAGLPCWKEVVGKGFDYKDKEASPDGITKLGLRAGLAGKAKVTLKGKGLLVTLPPLGPGSHTLPLKAQLRTAGQCWEANFSTATVDTSTQWKAKAD